MIRVSLNNEAVELENAISLQSALERWHYAEQKCAVAINGEFVPRALYAETQIRDRDEIDIVAPVGGG